MTKQQQLWFTMWACALFLILLGTAVFAQSSARFDLTWHVVGGGGQPAGSSSYRVHGTVGQAFAGPPDASSAAFAHGSGYWVFESSHSIYLPIVVHE